MAKPGLFISDVKINFRLRDFFLDFMACIVPGLIFLFAITIIVVGTMVVIIFDDRILSLYKSFLDMENNENLYKLITGFFSSFSFNFWFVILVTIFSYFTGHLLYRQTPKIPDFASFLRIRKKVIKIDKDKDDWVIEKGKGIKAREVQFPYSNLINYLNYRGFSHLTQFVEWSSVTGHGSKTMINRAKIRISFFFPEHTIHMIRNEAHIRLASSMWYAAKYILTTSYITIFLMIVFLYHNSEFLKLNKEWFLTTIMSFLVVGYFFREIASMLMRWFPDDNKSEKKARIMAYIIDKFWQTHDMVPFICNIILIISIFFIIKLNDAKKEFIIAFLGVQAFVLIGFLFAKFKIESTIHYQRVREIIYVLETAYLTKVLEEKLPNPLYPEKISYDVFLSGANINLNYKENDNKIA